MRDFPELLAEKVKPELNHIYTERPARRIGGLDCGWYCREHALHLYGLASMLGKFANICLGDFILRRPGGDTFFSVGDRSDHAWCRIDDCTPVDLSMTIKYIYPDIPDVRLICGKRRDLAIDFEIEYHVAVPDAQFMEIANENKLTMAYNEKSSNSWSLTDLLADPFQFLHRPPTGTRSFQELFGAEVFFAITHHCYRLLTEDIKPLCRYLDPWNTVARIVKYNPNARMSVESILSSAQKLGSS